MGESAKAEPGPIATDRRRPGPVRAAVDRRLRELTGTRTIRAAFVKLEAEQVVLALLAQQYAAAVDRASSSSDDGRLLAAGEKLRAILASLQAPVPSTPEGGTPDDSRAGSSGRIRELFSGRPALGNAAES